MNQPKKTLDPKSATFHTELRAEREKRKLTQRALAEAVGVTPRTVSCWEAAPDSSIHLRPRGSKLLHLYEFLGMVPRAADEMLTIAEAKRLLALSLGVPESAIEITVRY